MYQLPFLQGRLSRFDFGLRLFLAFAPLLPAHSLLVSDSNDDAWLRFLAAGLLLAFCISLAALLAVRRLHDVGLSGWWALALLLPGLNLVGYALLLGLPGKPEAKRGRVPQQPAFSSRSADFSSVSHLSSPARLTEDALRREPQPGRSARASRPA